MIGYSDHDSGMEEMVFPKIDVEMYRELFELSAWMLKARPWERMFDYHCFAIVDPDSGDEQIAVVMGNAGQVFALHLYQPEEGIRWLTRAHMSGGQDALLQHDGQYDQRLLEVEFSNGLDLDEHDKGLLDAFAPEEWAKVSRSGHLSCATFRSVRPGFAPWHPDEAEARRMLDGLRLLRRFYENEFLEFESAIFTPDEKSGVEIPWFRLPKGGDRKDAGAWSIGLEKFRVPPPKSLPEVPKDDLFVARLDDLSLKGTRWEIGAIFVPKPVIHGGRPVFPVVVLVVESQDGMVESVEMGVASDCRVGLIRKTLSKAATARGYLPYEIAVASPVAELALKDLSAGTGVKIIPAQILPSFNSAATSLLNSPGFVDEGDGDEEVMGVFEDLSSPTDMVEVEGMISELMAVSDDPEALGALMNNFKEQGEGGKALGKMVERLMNLGPSEAGFLDWRAPKSRNRFVFRVDLKGMKPPVWRRMSLPTDATFFDLHLAVQAAFGWEGCHMHAFRVQDVGKPVLEIKWSNENRYAPPLSECLLEKEVKLEDVFNVGRKKVSYCYDFGDSWDHLIKLEKEIEDKTKGEVEVFEVIKGKGGNPVEDCGGVWGLNAIIEGDHPFCDSLELGRLREIQNGVFHVGLVVGRDPVAEMELMDEMWGK